jgi:molecular chaperone GrpE
MGGEEEKDVEKRENGAESINTAPEKKEKEAKDKEMKEQHQDQNSELKDRMLRLAAEFDNYKKRTRADIEKAKDIGKAELIRNVLPVLDEFELALMAHGNSEGKDLSKGIEMVYSNLIDSLKRAGLSEIEAKGAFDPYKHEIILSRPDGKRKPGTIIEVVKKGYSLNGIMIRPASVIIAKEADEAKV